MKRNIIRFKGRVALIEVRAFYIHENPEWLKSLNVW